MIYCKIKNRVLLCYSWCKSCTYRVGRSWKNYHLGLPSGCPPCQPPRVSASYSPKVCKIGSSCPDTYLQTADAGTGRVVPAFVRRRDRSPTTSLKWFFICIKQKPPKQLLLLVAISIFSIIQPVHEHVARKFGKSLGDLFIIPTRLMAINFSN